LTYIFKKNLRAIDIEQARQAELKCQLDMVAKGALVHSVKVKKNFFYLLNLNKKKYLFRNTFNAFILVTNSTGKCQSS